ncbi:MAG: hypothetical protein NTU53_18455 [Planctomycetota bacterium]|nr:hypothetical protein [Planctomycetota bacterium]
MVNGIVLGKPSNRGIDSMHSFMLLRHGYVVAEGWWSPYSAESNHALYSLSKSFTSTRPQEGSGSAAKVLGTRYVFPANDRKLESLTLAGDGKDGAATLITRIDGVERRIACGRGTWQKARMAWGQLSEQPVAASGAWTADDTFTARLCFYETPFVVTVTLKFVGQELRYNSESNVGFGPTREPQLVGKAQ